MARSVHLLVVHGVGRHDPLSSLLQIYQSFRSNLRSPEAPIVFEDRIPYWRLDEVNEHDAPPYLKLVPRVPGDSEDVGAVYLYEVNYSALAGVVRQNHPLDLTRLFVGFDLAVAISRQRLDKPSPTVAVGDPIRLARVLQRVSGVLAAATVPILGVPSLLLRNYTETFVSTFTRFFEDVATFALDKNGEQLIAAHIDRTIENIVGSTRFSGADGRLRSDFVIAAHSLGSVVVHNYLIGKWTNSAAATRVPDRLVTFGSPIGLITWLWLFLDFPGLVFDAQRPTGSNFFCWSPQENAGKAAKPITWINVVNAVDPIATAFPLSAADLSRQPDELRAGLHGGVITHRFCGDAKLSSVGTAHTNYIHDRPGFIEILLRTVELNDGDPADVPSVPRERHWRSSRATLATLHALLWMGAIVFAAIYCGLVAWKFKNARVIWSLPVYLLPQLTIWLLGFWQRLFFGGPTKRIPEERINELSWRDVTSFPYRLRAVIGPLVGAHREVDPNMPAHAFRALGHKLFSFLPTVAAMLWPVAVGAYVADRIPDPRIPIVWYIAGVGLFTIYLIACALCEFVASWKSVLDELGLGSSS